MHNSPKWLPWTALAWVAFMVLFSFRITTIGGGPNIDGWLATALIAVLFVLGIAGTLTIRYLFLPNADKVPEERKHLVPLMSYMFVTAPAVYGLGLATFTGNGLIGLPFGAIALVGLLLLWQYRPDA